MGLYNLHVLGVPFTATSRGYLGDAMTQNIFNMCRLLNRLGHKVYHYGNSGSDADCLEQIDILTADEMNTIYSAGKDIRDARNGFYAKQSKEVNEIFMQRIIEQVATRKKTNDFILGVRYPHPEITRHHTDMIYMHHSVGHMEPGPPATIFASEYIRNLTLGVALAQTKTISNDPRTAVLPHFVFSEEFDPCYEPDDYFLYLGRLSPEKGLDTAIKVCKQLDHRLIIAGQGNISDYGQLPACCEYLGYIADINQRNELLRKAKALIMPSRYEAFGTSAIEALMSGVPLLTTDLGSFPEINKHGSTGYRCSTIAEFIVASKNINRISRHRCREIAEKRFSYEAVASGYQHYLDRLFMIHTGQDETPWFTSDELESSTHS